MASTVWWSTLYLGNLAPMDTTEGSSSYTIENSAPILQTFGAEGDPLAAHIVDVRSYSADRNTQISSDNADTKDTVTYDLGAGGVTAQVDAIMLVHGTAEFYDGTTFESDFGVFQATNGDTFLLAFDSQSELASAGIQSITITSVVNSNYSAINQTTKDDNSFVCFAPGTRIDTPFGPRRADRLRVGELVHTLDHGPQLIRWIGKRRLRFAGPHPAQPVVIAAGAMGTNLPQRDLLLSPNHRVLVATRPTHALHDPLGALAPAKALTRQHGVRIARGRHAITYYSLLLPMHAVIIAEGVAVESLYPGPEAWDRLSGRDRSAWLALAARARVTGVPPARLLLSTAEARAGLEAGAMALPACAPVASAPVAAHPIARARPLWRRRDGPAPLLVVAG